MNALHCASITFESREIHSELSGKRRTIVSQILAMMPALLETQKESNMSNKLLGAAAIAAMMFAVAPASAAKVGMVGCSGENMAKAEAMVEAMADSPEKYAGFKEVTAAQTAMLDGKMGACSMHIHQAMHVTSMK
jgi:hypothetical protein